MRRLLLAFLLLLVFIPTATAEEPFFAFEPGGGTTQISPGFQAWHPQFEDDGDYGESWFFLAYTKEGHSLFALLSITNLGLNTFDGIVDVQFYTNDGKAHHLHKEYKRKDVSASTEKMDVKIGKSSAKGGGRTYTIAIDEDEMKLQLTLINKLPPYMFGDGSVKFYKDKSAEWTLGMNVPAGVSSGSVTVDGKTFDLAGMGYHDHGWASIKLPDCFSRWSTLRLYDPKYSIVFHQQKTDKKFGSKINQFGLFGVDGKIKGALKNFRFKPTKARKDPTSKYTIPTAYDIAIKSGGYTVKGTVTESRWLEAVDVLGQVSWPVRMVIKAFYANPFMHRYVVHYELDVTDNEGKTEHISGEGIAEANYF